MKLKFTFRIITFSWAYDDYPSTPIYFLPDEVRWMPTHNTKSISMAAFYQKHIPKKL